MEKFRMFQIDNFPSEVSLQNPEALISVLSVGLFAFAVFTKRLSFTRPVFIAALCLGTLPVLMFHARFTPDQPIALWERLLEGGAAQNTAINETKGVLRIDESGTAFSEMIFPNAMSAMFKIHAVHGYSALQPPSLFSYPAGSPPLDPAWKADFAAAPDFSPGILSDAPGENPSRFRFATTKGAAPVTVENESMNILALDVSFVPAGAAVVRTDTWYPGWSENGSVPISKLEPCFSKFIVSADNGGPAVTFSYSPTGLKTAPFAMGTALLLTGTLFLPRINRIGHKPD